MPINIKPILDQAGVALQSQAANMFGAAVEDFARNNLGGTLGINNTAVRNQRRQGMQPTRPQGAQFVPTSYAAALAGGTSYRPKLKFLFKVEFIFTQEAKRLLPDLFGSAEANDFTFMIKAVDRPKIDFEYEDDVNMYNFRTKVLKRIRHRELTMTFMDDSGNRVINFYRGLMMLISPITRRQVLREDTIGAPTVAPQVQQDGMTFSTLGDIASSTDSAIRGVVNSDFGNIIETIRVKQIYTDPSADLSQSAGEVIFDFINARLVSFDLDDLSYDLSEVAMVTMQFDYDWLEIVDVGVSFDTPTPLYYVDVPGSTAPIDVSVPETNGDVVNSGGLNPFASIIGGTAGRITSTISSNLVNRAVQSVAGNGLFGSVIGNYASNAVSGIIGGATRDIVAGASQVMSTAAKSIYSNFVNDSAAGGATRVVGITSSTGDKLGNFISNLRL